MTHEHPDQPTLSSGAHSLPKEVHLVGSIPLSSAEEVFRTTSSILGKRLRRIPDGETGIRSGWIGWQFQLFASSPMFEMMAPLLLTMCHCAMCASIHKQNFSWGWYI